MPNLSCGGHELGFVDHAKAWGYKSQVVTPYTSEMGDRVAQYGFQLYKADPTSRKRLQEIAGTHIIRREVCEP